MISRKEQRPYYLEESLRDFLSESSKKRQGGEKVHLPSAGVDLEKNKRRSAISAVMNNRFREKSLDNRLGAIGDVSSYPSELIRQGMLGFLPDEILISDIAPQGLGEKMSDRLTFDPLWVDIGERMDYHDVTIVVKMFESIETISKKLEDQDKKESIRRLLKQDHLLTLGDLRAIESPEIWEKMPAFGKKGAKIMYEVAVKIEE